MNALHPPFGFGKKTRRDLLVGIAAWLLYLAWAQPTPLQPAWARAVLLLAPLVIVPLCLRLISRSAGFQEDRGLAFSIAWATPAALLFTASFLLPQGWWSFSCALPWVALNFVVAGSGIRRLLLGTRHSAADFCVASGMAYFAVAGFWALADRSGYRPFDYDPEIVFLTIVHFHYAGFLLPVLTGFAAGRLDSLTAQLTSYLVVAGVAMVAAGILLTQMGLGTDWEMASAWWMSLSGLAAAALHLRLATQPQCPTASRWLWGCAAAAIVLGMLLAGLYGSRFISPVAWLDIPTMWALHGTANAVGFGLLSTLGWWASQPPDNSPPFK